MWGSKAFVTETNLISSLPGNAVALNDGLPPKKSVTSLTSFFIPPSNLRDDLVGKIFHRVLFLGRKSEKEFVLQTGTIPQPSYTLVAGDVLFVREARLMGVDARVLFHEMDRLKLKKPNLKTEEAAVTGEVEPIEKYEAFDKTKNSVKEAPTMLLDKSTVKECRIPVKFFGVVESKSTLRIHTEFLSSQFLIILARLVLGSQTREILCGFGG